MWITAVLGLQDTRTTSLLIDGPCIWSSATEARIMRDLQKCRLLHAGPPEAVWGPTANGKSRTYVIVKFDICPLLPSRWF